MIKRSSYRSITWIDVESPTEAEISSLIKEFKLHPMLGEELAEKSLKSKVEIFKNCVYTVLHFPIRTQIAGRFNIIEKEVDFIVGDNFIITTRYETIEPLHNFAKIFEVNSILDKEVGESNAGLVWYYMLKRLYKNIILELDGVKDELSNIEGKVFKGEEKEMVEKLSQCARELIDFAQMIKSHGEVLQSVRDADLSLFFGKEFRFYMEDINMNYTKILQTAVNHKELLNDLRETNDSLLSTKQNETMKILTMMAFITFPLSLIADLFSLNTSHTPILGGAYDFEIVLGIMVVACLIMLTYFKRKKWI